MAENTAKLAADSVGECAPDRDGHRRRPHRRHHRSAQSEERVLRHPSHRYPCPRTPTAAAITRGAFDRKAAGKSVDPAGGLGSLLDGRHKPPPVVDQPWFEEKASVAYIASAIALAASGGQQPPFGLDKGKLGLGGPSQPAGISVDLASIQLVPRDDKTGTDVLFQVT